MATLPTPAMRRGALGSEPMAGTSTRADTAVMRDRTMTSLTQDKDRRGKATRRSPASPSVEQFSKDVQAHAAEMSLPANLLSSSSGVRKRKHSDDPATAVASRASTPGHHESPLSHSASSSSTPPSSIPSVAASPRSFKPSDVDDSEYPPSDGEPANGRVHSRDEEQARYSKRQRVSAVDQDDRHGNGLYVGTRRDMYPIVIGDDEYGSHHNLDSDDALSTHADDDALSTQANDDASVVEVNEGSPEPSVISLGRGMSRRDPSPVVSHVSDETDQTITPDMTRRANGHSRSSATPRGASSTPRPRPRATPTVVDVDEERPTTSRRNDPDEDEVIEVIDLTRPERRDNYPRGDSLPRVPGFTPQHSFQLPTLQRLVSRSSESMERSQRRSTQTLSSIDVHEIPDDDDENGGNNDEDRFGNDTVRIDSQVREVQLDPHHPWARGPIQLILSPEPPERHQYAEDQRQRRLEDATLLDDHLVQIDYNDAESENDLSQEAEQEQEREGATTEDDGVTDEQVQAEVNGILSLRREPRTPSPWPRQTRTSQSRSPGFDTRPSSFGARSFSFEARPSPFPTSSRSTTPGTRSTHRFSPVARRPSPVPLILRDSPQPRSRLSRSPSFSLNRSGSSGTNGISNQGVTVLQITQGADSNDKQEVIECWYMENLRCSICIEVMEIPTMIKCGHAFCRACIDKAMESSRTCPMCRNPVNRSKMIELEFMLQERPASGGSSTTTGPTTTTTTNGTGGRR
ncbi:hypothetical protein B0O80DRAFT_453444 [Mortierella sp. GBAus27b]|nr:hypothetical protein B0O80DRAFT_453444 [Mortierella sp. GBAus27b]